MTISNNKSNFFIENSTPCDKACQRIYQIGQESDQQAQENYFLSSKRNNETMGLNQDSSASLSFGS